MSIQQRIDQVVKLAEELKDVQEALLQERARREADLRMTPGEHLEELRKHALKRVEEGRAVRFFDSVGCYVIFAEPYPSKYEGAWRLHGDRSEWYEKKVNVVERVEKASMFGADVGD